MEWKTLLSKKRLGGELRESYKDKRYERSEFEKDYGRIVSSASFRRLQDKTQVFPLDSSDFVRTRLTHSLEVSSIAKELGKAVVKFLAEKGISSADDIPDILRCAGLLHDIGNPPFGHFGETVIGDWYKNNCDKIQFCGKSLAEVFEGEEEKYKDLCSFEGNAQAFRLLTKLHFMDSDWGMNLTSAVLNTIVKYPCSSIQKDGNCKDIKYHKMGYFQGDKDSFETVTGNTGTRKGDDVFRHPLTYLLEAADDIAYATADLEDGHKKGLFTLDEFKDFLDGGFEKYKLQMNDRQKKYTRELFDELDVYRTKGTGGEKKVSNTDLYAMQRWLDYVREWLMYCAIFGFNSNYDKLMQGKYQKEILEGTNHEFSVRILKDAMGRFIYPQPRILKLELAADSIISTLLDKFVNAVLYYDYAYKDMDTLTEEENKREKERRKPSKGDEKLIHLLPDNYVENYKLESKKAASEEEKLYYRLLLVNDFISGMTDTYAKTLYQELSGIY